MHPYAGLVALGTGQRHFPLPGADDDDEEEEAGDEEERRLLTEEAGASRLVLYRLPRREAPTVPAAAVAAVAEETMEVEAAVGGAEIAAAGAD